MILLLQLILVTVALVTVAFMLLNIRKSNIKIEDSIFWFFFSFLLLFFALFPQVIILISKLLGFESPANFVFLVMIFMLIINQYRMMKKMARLDIKLKELIQVIAIADKERQGR